MPDLESRLQPPIAARRPTTLTRHGDARVDEWYWLRDRDDPATIAYLEAENAYTEAMTSHTAALREELFAEIRARIQETDTSAPVPHGNYAYYRRTVEGLQYAIHCRRRREDGAAEEVILDENILASGHEFFALGVLEMSPDQRVLAYSTDIEGNETYTLRFRNLETGDDLPDTIGNTYYSAAWANDNRTILYTTLDEAKRPWQVWRHVLGTDPKSDVLVLQEDDDAFFASAERTRSGRYIVVGLGSMVTSEGHLLDADEPTGTLRVVEPRRHAVEYGIEHQNERFLIVTNDDGAVNFKLMTAPVEAPGRDNWQDLLPHRDDARIESVDTFSRHVAVFERSGGIRRMRLLDPAGPRDIDQEEPIYTATPGPNLEFDTSIVRFHYTSLVTPASAYDLDMETGERTLVKQQPVLGGYDATRYETSRLWATASDGVQVPISLVYRRDLVGESTPAPMLLYGYGSYESSIDPAFSSLRLSLLDRGVVFAIAHVRGGGEMGRRWYEDGKFLLKRNTFTDFIACADHLVQTGRTAPDRLAARGGSAGGMLMGAVANARPDLFAAIVAEVPFVDCLTTILDETLPLTVIEWDEWGNPNEKEFYDYMKSYSPYDNVTAQAYPPMLVTAGLNDPRVSYWEPAKWVAKLRTMKTDDNMLLLKTEMGAGHGGPSGRYDAWKDEAFVYAFVLDALSLAFSRPD